MARDVPTTHGDRVALEPLRDEDVDAMFDWINDRAVVIRSAPFRPVSREEHEEWFLSVRTRSDTYIFGIRDLTGDRLVGSCQLHGVHPINRDAKLRIRIGSPAEQGKGYGKEAVRLLLGLAFTELALHRVDLHVLSTNESARALYRSVGFREEGRLREAACIEDQWVDLIVMGVLAHEYRDGSGPGPGTGQPSGVDASS